MNEKKTTVTLEDLLRVKRAERPPQEYWARFDREMRYKELAAIVEPRPWWAPLIRVGTRVARYQLPIGAAAILALSVVTVREYRTSEYISSDVAAPATSESVATAPEAKSDEAVPAVSREVVVNVAPAMAAAPASNVGVQSHTAPLAAQLPRLNDEPSPSARVIAANLAAVQASNPRLVDGVLGGPVEAPEARQPVSDPLAHVQVGLRSESRRARLLSSALPVGASVRAVSFTANDRVVRRLTDEQLYDRVSRLDGDANRLVIKF